MHRLWWLNSAWCHLPRDWYKMTLFFLPQFTVLLGSYAVNHFGTCLYIFIRDSHNFVTSFLSRGQSRCNWNAGCGENAPASLCIPAPCDIGVAYSSTELGSWTMVFTDGSDPWPGFERGPWDLHYSSVTEESGAETARRQTWHVTPSPEGSVHRGKRRGVLTCVGKKIELY